MAKRTAMWFGTFNIYLYHEMFFTNSEVVFIGMPANVEVCYQVYSQLYKLFKKANTAHKNNSGDWGSKNDIEEDAVELRTATVHWLRHTGISEDVKTHPREHV